MEYVYQASPQLVTLLTFFPDEPYRSIIGFLNNIETRWEQVNQLSKILRAPNINCKALFERISHAVDLQESFPETKDLALFYQGRVSSMEIIAVIRDIYWRLREHEESKKSSGLKNSLNILRGSCFIRTPPYEFEAKIRDAFLNVTDLQEFIANLESSILPKDGGFNGRARYQVVERAVGVLLDPSVQLTHKDIATRIMGSIIQLRWYPYTISPLDYPVLITKIEKLLEIVTSITKENKKMRSLLLTQLNQILREDLVASEN